MSKPRHIDYAALYQRAEENLRIARIELKHKNKRLDDLQKIIVVLQDQYSASQNQVRNLEELANRQNQIILTDKVIKKELEQVNNLQKQTISQQSEQIAIHLQVIDGMKKDLDEKNKRIEIQDKQIALGTHHKKVLRKNLYGRKSEKFRNKESNQNGPDERIPKGAKVIYTNDWLNAKEHKPRGKTGELDSKLPRETILLLWKDAPENAIIVDQEITETLEHKPEKFYVKRVIRNVYLVPDENKVGGFKNHREPLPVHPIPKCKAGVSMIVKLMVDKFGYGNPLYRQHQRMGYEGLQVPYNTTVDWTNAGCEILLPLWELQLHELKSSGFMHVDETHYTTILKTKLGDSKSHRGWLWCLVNPIQKIVCFKYSLGRGKKDIADVLECFKGNLLTDAYGVYTEFGESHGVQHGKCMSHSRRKFYESLQSDPVRAKYVLDNFMGPLYVIERECKRLGLDCDEVLLKRQQFAIPILDAMFTWLKEEQTKVVPRTPISFAINYTLKIEKGLRLYCSDGLLSIDNNINEQQIRKVAVGRKNHLFAGSENGARNAAIVYSFFATCHLQRINPAQWLEDVLTRICDQPKDKLYELLPQFWRSSCVADTG